MSDGQKSRARALDDSVSRAIRDNLAPLQRSIEELQQAYADLVSACSSSRPTNALPAMLRAQACSASVSASLSVLSTFIAGMTQRYDRQSADYEESEPERAVEVEAPLLPAPAKKPPREAPAPKAQAPASAPVESIAEPDAIEAETPEAEEISASDDLQVTPAEEIASEPVVEESAAAFDISALPANERDMHKRADRVAKVSMQDIKMLKPEEVRVGRESKDICVRLRSEIDKARKEYDRRFQAILEHPVDHFHHWLVEILGGGDPETLGEYPYPSPVLRR
ncbi:MAG TPA: hypothetical protein VN745_08650 [Verrucomicrobiae bacterium]|nr:hypothetical protein [Verrucomicrobiae bacterium]